jgi:hypothetical protein
VKYIALFLLVTLAVAYLGLCAYGIGVTGSTEGLADIGNAAAMTLGCGALAAFFRRDDDEE